MRRWARAALLAPVITAGCAAKPPRAVDLSSARQALDAARAGGAAERAPEQLTRAEAYLEEAEALAAGTQAADACRAEGLGRLVVAEASCAEALSRAASDDATLPAATASPEAERLAGRLRRAEDDARRLEERVTVLQRDLEMTETEVIRTKARLKGTETKAEASSALAEARILMRRLADERARPASLARGQELIARAEELLRQENFSAAAFFALKAQELATRPHETRTAPSERPAPKPRYVVRASLANIRRGPGPDEPVVGKAPREAVVEALAVRGDWVKVTHAGVTGWIHRSLLE
jgi:hypothetical protein